MSASRTTGRLLRLYPAAWRARYGQELEALIVESSGGTHVSWRTRVDVARGACRERLREAGLAGDGGPADEVRAGALLTLCAWAAFVVAAMAVQRYSEHWQDVTPVSDRQLPSAAFAALVIAAGCGSVLVLAGIASAIPSLVALLRGGGWPIVRRRVFGAVLLTFVAAAGTVGLVAWAHGLTGRQRNGGDATYAIAFVTWVLLVVSCLVAWTSVAVAAARRLHLPKPALRTEARMASLVTVAMAAMTAATVVWWVALAEAAPWFLAGRPVGSSVSPFAPEILAAGSLMLVATLIGAIGSRRAMRALPALADA